MSAGRHFYRCADCLIVFAIDAERTSYFRYAGDMPHADEAPKRCDCGSARLHWMGRVVADRVIATAERCACDSRCTTALGPKCLCSCGGKNHGTDRVVRVTIDNGAAVIPEQPGLAARVAGMAAVKAAAEAARVRINRNGILDRMAAGEFIRDRAAWDAARFGLTAIRKACALQSTLAARVKKLNAIGAAGCTIETPVGFVADLFQSQKEAA